MSDAREKFATQADPALLEAIRRLAREEGRQFQALVDEAFTDLLEKRRLGQPRALVRAAYLGSHGRYASLYEKLAK